MSASRLLRYKGGCATTMRLDRAAPFPTPMSAFRAALSLLDGAPAAAARPGRRRASAPAPGVHVLPADLTAAARRRRVVLDLVSDCSRSLHVLFLHGLDCFSTGDQSPHQRNCGLLTSNCEQPTSRRNILINVQQEIACTLVRTFWPELGLCLG